MTMSINIGLNQEICHANSDVLCSILANEYFLYQKTLSFHWNVTGESFIGLHKLLEEHYEWLKETIDSIAERIRALGFIAPGSYKKYDREASLSEANENQTAREMLHELVFSHAEIIRQIRESISNMQGKQDYATEELLTKILQSHEKITWMLRSHLLALPC